MILAEWVGKGEWYAYAFQAVTFARGSAVGWAGVLVRRADSSDDGVLNVAESEMKAAVKNESGKVNVGTRATVEPAIGPSEAKSGRDSCVEGDK